MSGKYSLSKKWCKQAAERERASEQPAGSELAVPSGYDAWLTEVRRLAKEELGWTRKALSDFPKWDGLREAFDEGLTPKEYWAEECAAAS